MVRIEFKRLLKEGIILLLLTCALMVHILTTDKDPYIPSVMLEVFLLLYASFTGWSMFDRERQENAVEYLLSMPVSRTRLLGIKILPRFVMVALIMGLYLLSHRLFQFPAFLPPQQFAIVYFSFFLISLSFSLTIRSFIGALFLTVFFSVGMTLYLKMASRPITDFNAILTANLIMLAFPLFFFIIFHTFDIKPLRRFNYKFLLPVIGIVAIAAGIIWFRSGYGWGHYYLAANKDVFRASCGLARAQHLHGGSADIKTEMHPSTLVLREDKQSVLVQVLNSDSHYTRSIDRIDLESDKRETLLEIDGPWAFYHGLEGVNGFIVDNTYYNLIRNSEENLYKIIVLPLDRNQSDIQEIPLIGNLQERLYFMVHITQQPWRFYLIGKNNLYWVARDGEIHTLMPRPKNIVFWKNRLLGFQEAGITVYRLDQNLTQEMNKTGRIRLIRWRGGGYCGSRVLINLEGHMHLLNMEDLSLQPLKMNAKPFSYRYIDNVLHLFWIEDQQVIFGHLDGEQAVVTRKLNINLKGTPQIIRPFDSGVVIFTRHQFQEFQYQNAKPKVHIDNVETSNN